MVTEVTTIQTGLYETTGGKTSHIQHEITAFEIMGTLCRERPSPEGDMMFLRIIDRKVAAIIPFRTNGRDHSCGLRPTGEGAIMPQA